MKRKYKQEGKFGTSELMSYQEIADILNLSVKEVKRIELNALRKLKMNKDVHKLFSSLD